LELLSVDDEIVLRQFPEEALQVKATLLQENNVLVADSLLWRHLGQHDARPSLLEAFLQEVKFVVASLALEVALDVLALDHEHDVAREVLRIADREVKSFDI